MRNAGWSSQREGFDGSIAVGETVGSDEDWLSRSDCGEMMRQFKSADV